MQLNKRINLSADGLSTSEILQLINDVKLEMNIQKEQYGLAVRKMSPNTFNIKQIEDALTLALMRRLFGGPLVVEEEGLERVDF
jgi:hypothetical protein